MRYTIELDASSKEGNELLRLLKKQKEGKVISIHKWKKLTAADVALPNEVIPTDWQWNEYLNRKQGKGKQGDKAFADIRKKLKG